MHSFFRRYKMLSISMVVLVFIPVWYLFRPERLFTTREVNEAAPFPSGQGAQILYTGILGGARGSASGRASVYRESNGTLTLHLTDLHTSNEADAHVLLAVVGGVLSQGDTLDKPLQSIEVGALKDNQGDRIYILPPQTDLTRYNAVAIYSERSRAVLGAAHLDAF
jgi:hypothetical protein